MTPAHLAILLDDGLFRGLPSWGRTGTFTRGNPELLDKINQEKKPYWTCAQGAIWVMCGGSVEIKDETTHEDRNTIYKFDKESLKAGLALFKEKHPELNAAMENACARYAFDNLDLTIFGDYVIQLGIWGEIRHGL